MIHRQKRDAFSIELTAKFTLHRRQRMGDHRHLQTMFETFSYARYASAGQRLINFMRGEMGENALLYDYLCFHAADFIVREEMKM